MNTYKGRKAAIQAYINAYNQFDVPAMLLPLSEDVIFQNYSGGNMNLETKGKEDFRHQAENACQLFSSRNQEITFDEMTDTQIKVKVNYEGILAQDLPNSLKKGDQIKLQGESIFTFEGDSIQMIQDFS
ncbi:MAG: nuclear transport factor 2 family protein [Bacteroidota bacterium]